jgi:hypothetical protein
MTRTRRALSGACIPIVALATWLVAAPAPAQERAAGAPSLRMAPADAGTYSVMLNGRETLEAILKSKAWARLTSMPVVKMGWQMVEAEWASGKLAQLRDWYEQPGNAELVRFFGELFEEEIFTVGGKNNADIIALFQELQTSNQFAPLILMAKHGPDAAGRPDLRAKLLLQTLAAQPERLKVPDAVVGFKLSRTQPAQVAKWLGALRKTLTQAAPPLAEHIKKLKIHGADVFTLELKGDMIPWDQVPLAILEDEPGQFEKLINRIKEMKLTIALSVRDNYVLLGLGETTAGLQAIGAGLPNRLSERAELAPLAKLTGRKLQGINYVSKEFATALAKGASAENMASWVNDLLKDAGLPADKQAKLNKDIKSLAADLGRLTPQPGASSSFAFSTKRGYESFSYDWGKNPTSDGSKPLSLLEHVGAKPLAFALSREQSSGEEYQLLVRLIKLGVEYFEDLALPQAPDQVRDLYEQFMKEARPLFARIDGATSKLLLPSLDGQGGIVVDGKWKSKQWHRDMPPADKDLPLPEIAIVLGVKDAAKLREAFKEYRESYNGLVDAFAKVVPVPIPDLKLPEPKVKKIKGGTLYTYPLPDDLGLDKRFMPTGGLSNKLAVFTHSEDYAQRLLTTTAWQEKGGPLADLKRPLASAGYCDFAGFIDLLSPWVEYGLNQAQQGEDVIDQVRTVMDVLKVFRSFSSATYLENNVVVTHSESIFRDLEK